MAWKPLPRAGGPPPQRVDGSLAKLMRHLGVPTASTLTSLHEVWAEVVGPALSEHAEPVTLTHGRLIVRVDDPAWAGQLRWMQQQVIGRLQAVKGYESTQTLEIRVGPPVA